MPKARFADWDEDDAFDEDDERPSRRGRKRSLPWLRLVLISSASITGLVYFAQHGKQEDRPAGPIPVPVSVLIAPAPVWRPVAPSPVYALEKGPGPVVLEAREHTSGAREDTLILGGFGEALHARLTFVQGLMEPPKSFFIDMVRHAAQAGLSVVRDARSRMVATKFGPVEAAPMTLAGMVEQDCQAFRFSDPEAGFGFHGWLCGSAAHAAPEAQLACLIDGITLAGAADPSVKSVFARAARNRLEACAPDARTASAGAKSPHRR